MPHRWVIDLIRMQVDVLEALKHLEQEPGFRQLADRVVEVKLLQHFAHVRAEARNVVAQVGCDVWRVGKKLFKIVTRRVVEGEAGGSAKLRIQVL